MKYTICLIAISTCASFFTPGFAQLPDISRRTSWYKAGIHDTFPDYTHLSFQGDTTGILDNSPSLQAIIDTITQPTIILIGEGTFLFNSRISLKSNIVLKGLGNNKTHLLFNQNGSDQASIQMRGNESGNYTVLENAPKNTNSILISTAQSANLQPGNFIRIYQDDADWLESGWGPNITGQVLKIDSIKTGRIYFNSPLRLDYTTTRHPIIRKQNSVKFAGVECLKISRADFTNTGAGSSNFYLWDAANCFIRSVESNKCNFAHVEMYYSTNTIIEDNYFYDAHSFASFGRGYGVMLQYATGEILVQNNIFRRLRHSMIVQAGANGNVFAYNYSYEGIKEIFPGLNVIGEDMVIHGNFPYLNLFEGNYAQEGLVDNTHGENGPYNTYFRNLTSNNGISVTNSASNSQNVTGNHRLKGLSTFSGADHHITDNSWLGSSTLSDTSLAFQTLPAFLSGVSNWLIGPPLFTVDVNLPAKTRSGTNDYISRKCDMIIWENGAWVNGFQPSAQTVDYKMTVYPGGNLVLSTDAIIHSVEIKPGANFQVAPGKILTINK